jgi:hypothetical protein
MMKMGFLTRVGFINFIYAHSLIILFRLPTSTRNGMFSTFNHFFFEQNWPPLTSFQLQIFKEGATFRGRLKTIAHHEVEKSFRDELHPPDNEIQSQRELKYIIERNVGDLLSGGKFLMGGKDNAVSHYINFYSLSL